MVARLLALSGSVRKSSFNKRLATRLATIAGDQGAEITLVDLSEFDLPIYNGDTEDDSGLPDAAVRLKRLLKENTGLIIACPEYNGFMTPLLTNTIDWCTRSDAASVDLSGFTGKTVLIASASPGPGGGSRAATHLKTMLSGIGSVVYPQGLTIASAHGAFDDQGGFVDPAMAIRAESLIKNFIEFTERFEQPRSTSML